MQDLKLNDDHDIDMSSNDLQVVTGLDYYAQKLSVVLKFFFAEWFLDTTIGIKFHEVLFVKNPNLTLIDNLFKITLSEQSYVQELQAYDSTFDSYNRKFTITYTVLTDEGSLSQTESIDL